MLSNRDVWRWGLFPLLVPFGVACSQRSSEAGEAVQSTHQALVAPAVEVLGFEKVADWSSTLPLSTSSQATQGAQSLGVAARGNITLNSATFTSSVAPVVSYDLFLPTQQTNPGWLGQTLFYLSCPA